MVQNFTREATLAIHIPGAVERRCSVHDCANVADQQHHASYARGYPDEWNRVWICRQHHQALYRLEEAAKAQGISLELLTLRYILNPEATTQRLQRILRAVPLSEYQMSFAEAPGGERFAEIFQAALRDIRASPASGPGSSPAARSPSTPSGTA